MSTKKVIIIGAAGRDFHNFNTYFRNNPDYEVVAFTAAQIPDIDGRKYPTELSGELYPEGIPVYLQEELTKLIITYSVDICVFSYSDVPNQVVSQMGAIVNSAGADFMLLSPKQTMLSSTKPVISVCATRTGAGKSQTSRKVVQLLMEKGLKVVAIRHPMPYGNLVEQKVQRFAKIEDLAKHKCTIEEMEEYEPHIARGNVIYAGVDYEAILRWMRCYSLGWREQRFHILQTRFGYYSCRSSQSWSRINILSERSCFANVGCCGDKQN